MDQSFYFDFILVVLHERYYFRFTYVDLLTCFVIFSDMKEDVVYQLTLMLTTAMHWVMLLELFSMVEKRG